MAIEPQNHHYTSDSVKGLLSQHGIKQTSQRIKIGKMLLSSPQHLSAGQVLSSVNQDSEIISKATVYNTLNLFVDKGLIRQVIIGSGRVFYDSNTSPHVHLYNEDSGELMDYEAGSKPLKLDDTLELPKDTIASGVDVIIRIKNKV
jgi:Fur family iron response transcriptional regulator